MKTSKLQNLLLYRYRYVIAYTVMLVASIGALTFHLQKLLPGVSPGEVEQGLAITQDSTTILEQGLYLPYNILQTISIGILGESALALRVPSVILGFLLLVAMYILIRIWHREKIAIISILFLATSSWFLTFARHGTPYIFLALSVAVIFLSGSLLRHSEHKRRWLLVAAALLPLTLYGPTMIYILILFAWLYRNEIRSLLDDATRANLVLVGLVGVTLILPLIYSFFSNTDTFFAWLGFPDGIPTPNEFVSNVMGSIQHILWRSADNPEFHLGDIAMLDIFTATMAALGLYHYEQHFNWLRTRFIIYGLAFMLVLFGLSDNEAIYFMAAPLIYILAATGIITLLNQWNRIFPVNPFARTLALIPIALALVVTAQYHLDRYFSAWALNPNTRKVYAVEPSLLESHLETNTAERILIITNESEHAALTFLLNDDARGRVIDIIDPAEGEQLSNIPIRYDVVYLDGTVTGKLPNQLNSYIFEPIESERETRPIAYRVYDLSAEVGVITP